MKRTPLRRKSRLIGGKRNGDGKKRPSGEVHLVTRAEVSQRQRGLCVCGCLGLIAPYPIGYHHVLPKAKWPELVDEAANIVGVTANCHANHETGARRLKRKHVACAERLATTGPMQNYLDRTYGRV